MRRLALLLWQLPQLALGLTLVLVLRASKRERHRGTAVYEAPRPRGGVSFGPIIIMNRNSHSRRLLAHEYGHSCQSVILGPLYLLVVGLPSVTFAMLTRAGVFRRETYFARFPENWADRLGGVRRG